MAIGLESTNTPFGELSPPHALWAIANAANLSLYPSDCARACADEPLIPNQSSAAWFARVAGRLSLQSDVAVLTVRQALQMIRRGARLAISPLRDEASSGHTGDANGSGSGAAPWFVGTRAGYFFVELADGAGGVVRVSRRRLTARLGGGEGKVACVAVRPGLDEGTHEGATGSEGGHSAHGSHASHDGHHHHSLTAQLWRLMRPDMADIAMVGMFSAVVGMLALATPIAVQSLVNTVAFGNLVQPLIVLSLILLIFLGFAGILRAIQTYVAEVIQRRLFVRVVADLAARLPRVRGEALDSHHAPELMNRFFDVMTVQKAAALLVLDGLSIVLQTAAGMAVLAFYHPLLLGFDLLLLASMSGIIWLLGRGAVRTAIAESKAKYAVAAWLEELAHNPLVFRSRGGPARAAEEADRLSIAYIQARKSHFSILLRQILFSLAMQAAAGSILLGLGGWLVISGSLTLGQLVAAELIVTVIVGSFAKFGKHLESFYDLLAAVDKLGHILDLPVERLKGASPPVRELGAAVSVEGVSYAYQDSEPVLNNVRFEAKPGQMAALGGASASGRSTMMDILFSLRQPQHGFVEFDGVDIRTMSPMALREQVVLLRDLEIFSATVAENVHLDRADLSTADVVAALGEFGLSREISSLPQGLDTVLRPSGEPLSASKATLLMLARAAAARPRLLLIDGLLDSLPDDVLESTMRSLRRMTRRTTIIIASGRQEILDWCDGRPPFFPESPEPKRPACV